MKKLVAVLIIGLCACNGYAFGPRGQHLVGAIADRRLAQSTNVAARKKLEQLLEGLSLEAVVTLPDSIKAWSRIPTSESDSFHVTGHPRIEAELRAFVKANQVGGRASHYDFHFADVPVLGNEKYSSSTVGRSEFDVVHMFEFCVQVLKRDVPEKNERAITKTIAVILLAHFLSDLHQPLHVGEQYFDINGNAIEPTPQVRGFSDQSGNRLNLFLRGKELSVGRLHGYWDTATVATAFENTPDEQTAAALAREEPKHWKLDSPVEGWGEALANEVLPIASEAYARLEVRNVKVTPSIPYVISGDAIEKTTANGVPYAKWSAVIARQQIHKAGWRLAALFETLLR